MHYNACENNISNFSYLLECYRWTYQEFFSRYRVLLKQMDVLPDRKQTCRNLMEKLIKVCLY